MAKAKPKSPEPEKDLKAEDAEASINGEPIQKIDSLEVDFPVHEVHHAKHPKFDKFQQGEK